MATMRIGKGKGRKNRAPKLTRVEKLTKGLLTDPRDVKSKFSIKEEEGKGRGVFLKADILRKDSFVLEYEGDIISEMEAQGREKIYAHNNEGCFIMFFTFKGAKWAIDATRRFNSYTRLLNHSRHPNIRFHPPILIDLNGKGLPRVAAYALRDIHKGEEIVFDYGVRDGSIPWLRNTKAGYTSNISSDSDEDEEQRKETKVCQMSMMISPSKAPCIDDYSEVLSQSSSRSTDKTISPPALGLSQSTSKSGGRKGLARKGYSVGEWGMRFTCLCPWGSEKSYMIGYESIGVPQKIHRFIEDCSRRHRNKSDNESVICLSTSSDGSLSVSESSAAKLRSSPSLTSSNQSLPIISSSSLPSNVEPDSINKVLDWDIPSPRDSDDGLNIKIIGVQSLSDSQPAKTVTPYANTQDHSSSDRQQNFLVNQGGRDSNTGQSIKALQNNLIENGKVTLHQGIQISEHHNNNNQISDRPTFGPGNNVSRQEGYKPVQNSLPKQGCQNERGPLPSTSLSSPVSCKQPNKQFPNKFPQPPIVCVPSGSGQCRNQPSTAAVAHKPKNSTGSPKHVRSAGLASVVIVPRHQRNKLCDNNPTPSRQCVSVKNNRPPFVPSGSDQQINKAVSSSQQSSKQQIQSESSPSACQSVSSARNTHQIVNNIAPPHCVPSRNVQEHSRYKTNSATPVSSTPAMPDQGLSKLSFNAPVKFQGENLVPSELSVVVIDHSESEHEKESPNPDGSKSSSNSSDTDVVNTISRSKKASPKGKKRTSKQADVCIISDEELGPNPMAAKKPKQVIENSSVSKVSDVAENELSSSSECEIVMEEGPNASCLSQPDIRENSLPARRVVGFSPNTSPPQVAVIKPYVAPSPLQDVGSSSPGVSMPASDIENPSEDVVITEAELEHLRKIFDVYVFRNKVSHLDIQETIYKNWGFFKELIERGISINQIRSTVRKFFKPTL